MALYCQKCGGSLKGAVGRMRCPVCGEKSVAREKHREPELIPATVYIRWLLHSIEKHKAPHGGRFLLETQSSMGKTSFWTNLAWNIPREEQYEDLHILWCDWGATLQNCHQNLRRALEDYGKRLSLEFSADVLQPDLSDPAARLSYVLQRLAEFREESNIEPPLVLVLDNIDGRERTGELLLEFLPEEENIPEGIFVILSLTQSSNHEFCEKLATLSFSQKMVLQNNSFSYDQMVKKMVGKKILHLNLKHRLTDGDSKVQYLCRLAQNRWSHIWVARQILQDFGEERFFRMEDETDLVDALLELKREHRGEEQFAKDLRTLVFLALLRQPVEARKCFPGEEDISKEISRLYKNYYSLVELTEHDDDLWISLRSNGFREHLRNAHRPEVEALLEEFLQIRPKKKMSEDQLLAMTYLPDMVLSFGTEAQVARLCKEDWLRSAVELANIVSADPKDLLRFYSEYIGGLLQPQLPQRGRWLAEAYLQREEIHGRLSDYLGQLHDYSAAIYSLRELPELSKNERQILCSLYEERGKLYAQHRNLDSGMKNMEKAIRLNQSFIDAGDVSAKKKMPELYLTRAKMQALAGKDEGAERDYRTTIELLRQHDPEDLRIAGVYSEWGGIAMKHRDVETGIRFYQDAVEFLLTVKNYSSATWKEQAAFAYSLLGKAQLQKKDYEAALRDFTEAVRLRENLYRNKQLEDSVLLARAYSNRGSVLSLMDRDEEALDDYSRAITVRVEVFDRTDESQVLGLAHIYLNRGVLFRKYDRTMEEVMEYTHGINLLSKLILKGKIRDENVFLLCVKLYQYRIQGYQKLGNESAVQEDYAAMDRLTAAQRKL